MARFGRMQLVLPMRDEDLMRNVVERRGSWRPDVPVPPIKIVPVGKSKSAFEIAVPKITNFSITASPPEFEMFMAAVDFLAGFYERASDLLPESLRLPSAQEEASDEKGAELRALRVMLFAYMRSMVTRSGTAMPFPLPDLRKLTIQTPEEERFFASLGLMGGFSLELREDEEKRPYILSSCWSRQGGSTDHKVTSSEVLRIEDLG